MKVKRIEIVDGPDGYKHLQIIAENDDIYSLQDSWGIAGENSDHAIVKFEGNLSEFKIKGE